jgi:hypothetical protein
MYPLALKSPEKVNRRRKFVTSPDSASHGLPFAGTCRGEMKFRQLEWLSDFVFMYSVFVAGNALRKLHSVGQPLIGLVSEAIIAAAAFSLFNYIRKHGDD